MQLPGAGVHIMREIKAMHAARMLRHRRIGWALLLH
jgi:hypothetical protein